MNKIGAILIMSLFVFSAFAIFGTGGARAKTINSNDFALSKTIALDSTGLVNIILYKGVHFDFSTISTITTDLKSLQGVATDGSYIYY